MLHRTMRSASPDSLFDISGSLVPNASLDFSEPIKSDITKKRKFADVQPGLDISNDILDGESDDEKYLATRQVAQKRAQGSATAAASKKSGGFQSMGLNPVLLTAIARKGFAVPTPIQRKAVPLILDSRDVVGMARTGSGKTAAFVIPMIEKLKSHSVTVGARAIVLSPSRELALQTLKAVKEFGRGTDLRTVLLMGGESFEDQFSQMTSNPDIVIATPGRFLHLVIEMRLDLSSVRYAVFDEADRLFEMGFAVQLNEILHALPPSRQTLLFSATLPTSLVEFAKAGLQDPTLIRLDADSKMSPDLKNAFLTVKSSDKEGALFHLLHEIIKMPSAEEVVHRATPSKDKGKNKKRKQDSARPNPQDSPTEHSTVIFAATKHHVEYLAALLRSSGFAVSYVYGSLDQTARQMQVESFRAGNTSILVVTDVAARGIDIPMLANVINYDFPSQPKLFLHRVGRTARAGRKGWSYSLLKSSDIPYLLDLQLFLGRKLVCGWNGEEPVSFADDMVVGSIPVPQLDRSCEAVLKLLDEHGDLSSLQDVASKGEKLYMRSRNSASTESVKRAKALHETQAFHEPNMLYIDSKGTLQTQREDMLARIGGFRPAETVFEFGKRGVASETAEVIKRRRAKFNINRERQLSPPGRKSDNTQRFDAANMSDSSNQPELYLDTDDELEITLPEQIEHNDNRTSGTMWHDSENFMGYQPKHANLVEEQGYGVRSGSSHASNFADAAREATMGLTNDESKSFAEASRPRQMRWDRRSKKYVATINDEDGSKGKKLIQGESGHKIAATFRSGLFDEWKRQNRISRLPKVGEAEPPRPVNSQISNKRFKHHTERAPKQPDKYRDDYYKKKKKLDEAKKANPTKVFDKSRSRNELRSVDDIRKARTLQTRRKEKNARRPKRKA